MSDRRLRLRPAHKPTDQAILRRGYTLLELTLALSLVVVATSLIGSLMSLYARSFSTRAEDVRRKQLARSVLAMIADDIRAVIVPSQFDTAAFEQLFGSESMDLDNLQLTGNEGDSLGLGSSGSSTASGGNSSSGTSSFSDLATSLSPTLPSGIYGNQQQLMVDVSRVPRIDEFSAAQMNMSAMPLGTPIDIPGDVKRVTYYVQAASPLGVQDPMAQIQSGVGASDFSTAIRGGLVRRQLDRAVTNYSESSGLSNSMSSVGDLVAPEVVALEFSYFDGSQWLVQWDSSQMGFPWLINITLAIQSATGEQQSGLPPGFSLSTLDLNQKQLYGIEVYELAVAIPGAQLIPKPSLSDSGALNPLETGTSGTGGTGALGL